MEARVHGTTKRQREESNDSPFNFVGSKILRLDSADFNLISPDLADSVSSDVKSIDSKQIGVDRCDDSGFGSLEQAHAIQEDLLKILDEGDDRESAVQDLDSVIRSFEKEIEVPVPVPAAVQPELGYLLQASDDELGLPPAGDQEGGGGGGGGIEEVNFGAQFSGDLGFEDEVVSNYYWLEGLSSENESNEGEEDQVVALGGLFDDYTAGTAAEMPPYRSETMYCL